jgi:hypothetical protein
LGLRAASRRAFRTGNWKRLLELARPARLTTIERRSLSKGRATRRPPQTALIRYVGWASHQVKDDPRRRRERHRRYGHRLDMRQITGEARARQRRKDAQVNQADLNSTVCTRGYTRSVGPPVNVTERTTRLQLGSATVTNGRPVSAIGSRVRRSV